MSRDTESVMSSAVSLSGVESLSDNGSTVSVGDKTGITRSSTNALFDLGDGDLSLTTNGTTLETHKFLIKRFAGLKGRIRNDTITMESGEPGLEVFQDALNILYASVIEGPFDFDHTTLISALLLATRYDYPALRTFAINKLENAKLSAVERIRLAREFDIPSWEEPAYLELCEREEPLTMPEAEVLGLKAVLYVGIIREKEERKKREEAEARHGAAQDEEASLLEAVEGHVTTPTLEGSSTQVASVPGLNENSQPALADTEPLPKPNFVHAPDLSTAEMFVYCSNPYGSICKIELPVLDCDCKADRPKWGPQSPCICKLPPCAVSAFKHLQIQQLAHKSDISVLKHTIEQMQVVTASLKPTDEPTKDTTAPSLIVSSTLQDDVKRWLVSQQSNVV
ncbi:hypothetical protein BDV93DRAFT_611007 [Ceratobasidium sp. AG-I]|nr:hypothetical protein BDV93DRAFT_611007 [Ceratobasidium sp. AG-I]